MDHQRTVHYCNTFYPKYFVLPYQNKPCRPRLNQGIAGDTNPIPQDNLVRVNPELGNFMAYDSYTNEETKSL